MYDESTTYVHMHYYFTQCHYSVCGRNRFREKRTKFFFKKESSSSASLSQRLKTEREREREIDRERGGGNVRGKLSRALCCMCIWIQYERMYGVKFTPFSTLFLCMIFRCDNPCIHMNWMH